MNVLVIGANGQIGKQIIELAKEENDVAVTAMVRKQDQVEAFQAVGTQAVLADLEGSVEHLQKAMEGIDAVVFTAGSGSHTGADKTILVDLDGAVKAVEAAEQAGVDRFIMISAFRAHDRDAWAESPIKHYMAAKHYADRFLVTSKLNYTILRPGRLLNEPGIGKVQAGELTTYGSIPREDVAKTVVHSLRHSNTYRRSFDLLSGEDTIEAALDHL